MKINNQTKIKFLEKINTSGPQPDKTKPFYSHLNPCWLWTGNIRNDGYGVLKGMKAHRISWFLYNGTITNNLCVLHKCDLRACVNPDHLFLGTRKENNIDRRQKGREGKRHGTLNGRSKLNESLIIEIRSKYIPRKVTLVQLAKEYGVSFGLISFIVKKRNWKHVI